MSIDYLETAKEALAKARVDHSVEYVKAQALVAIASALIGMAEARRPAPTVAPAAHAERRCKCGWRGFVDGWGSDVPPNFCPRCGGIKVVGE